MYIVREIFYLHFGQYKAAKALVDEAIKNKLFSNPEGTRMLTDFTGQSYRFIMELPFKTLGDFEKELSNELNAKEWSAWYERFKPLVRTSEREILKQIK